LIGVLTLVDFLPQFELHFEVWFKINWEPQTGKFYKKIISNRILNSFFLTRFAQQEGVIKIPAPLIDTAGGKGYSVLFLSGSHRVW